LASSFEQAARTNRVAAAPVTLLRNWRRLMPMRRLFSSAIR
jgi:hypothetical protein